MISVVGNKTPPENNLSSNKSSAGSHARPPLKEFDFLSNSQEKSQAERETNNKSHDRSKIPLSKSESRTKSHLNGSQQSELSYGKSSKAAQTIENQIRARHFLLIEMSMIENQV